MNASQEDEDNELSESSTYVIGDNITDIDNDSFDENSINYGKLHETPCSGGENFGQFDAMVEKGDVLGIFSGHDHVNDVAFEYENILLVLSSPNNFISLTPCLLTACIALSNGVFVSSDSPVYEQNAVGM